VRTPSNILIIRFSSIGDIVLASPVVRFLRERFPDSRIDFLTKKKYAELLRWNPGLTNIILFDEDADDLKALRARIREMRYDLIVDLHNSLRSIYLRTFSGARRVRVFRKHAFRRFLLVRFKKNLYRRPTTVVERYIDTVRIYGDPTATTDFPLPDDLVRTATGVVYSGKFTPEDRLVGFAPTAMHFTKRWPMDRFVRAGIALATGQKVRILIFGSQDEAEYCSDIAHMINSGASAHAAESFAGRLSLSETAAAAGLCSVMVSNDTGLMHIAEARGVPVVALFGSSVKEFGFAPLGPKSVLVENAGLACRPCSHVGRKECPKEHFKCMKDITPERVHAEVARLLGGAIVRDQHWSRPEIKDNPASDDPAALPQS
jgi:lipopolysaccharide heptosyltransferase II